MTTCVTPVPPLPVNLGAPVFIVLVGEAIVTNHPDIAIQEYIMSGSSGKSPIGPQTSVSIKLNPSTVSAYPGLHE